MEITSSSYKNEIEAKENNMKGKNEIGVRETTKKRKIEKPEVKKKRVKKDNENWFCKLCKEERQESMIQCSKCAAWVHDLCAGVDNKTKKYICDICDQSIWSIDRMRI